MSESNEIMSNRINLSIIIPTYNDLDKLRKALKSIELIDYPHDNFEVVVVDDGSTDQTEEFLLDYAQSASFQFHFFCQANQGPAVARNLAIQNTRGDYLLSIDSDCYVDGNILKEYLKYFPCEGLAGVGGDAFPDNSNYISSYLRYRGTWKPGLDKDEVIFLITANAFFSKKAILDVGGFDEDFRYPGGEEVEMCYRLKKKGYFFLFEENAAVTHAHRTSLKGLIKTYKTYGLGARIMAEKWEDLKWTKKRVRNILLGLTAMSFAFNSIKSVGLFRAISYLFLEQVRLISFVYGYYNKK